MELASPVSSLAFVGPAYAKRLEKLGIITIQDLLHHVPHRYLDLRKTAKIQSLVIDDFVTVRGKVLDAKNQYTRQGRKIQMFTIFDGTGELEIVWFNQPYLTKTIRVGSELSVAGKVAWYSRKKAIISPEYEMGDKKVHTGRLLPIYHETNGITSKWLRKRLSEVLGSDIVLTDFLSEKTKKDYKLISLKEAINAVHFPKNLEDTEAGRKRLAFNELLTLQLSSLQRKKDWLNNEVAYKLKLDESILKTFTDTLEFELTASQKSAIKDIFADLKEDIPMNRLLEGDVGSGKTVVAAAGIFACFVNGYQAIIMAPTQILAQQHYNTLTKLFEPFKIRVSLITSTTKESALGKTDVFVGTHALIHQKLNLDEVAFIVIDEQHRFGVEQRTHLVKKVGSKNVVPHVLTMTATPIPRTIALTLYGDLELSTLSEMPKDRQKIVTWLVPPNKREGAYGWINEEIIKNKVQAYIVCPLIEESDKESMQEVKAVKAEYERLTKVFKNLKVGLLHGKLKPKEKNAVLDEFKSGKMAILVSTPVIEVGIDVTNATIMMIEAAERFGLAQLHQLRGRVGRGPKKSYCLVMTESESIRSLTRLEALKKTHSGFELAELDLKLRGPGEVFGTKQSGFPELKIASWQDINLIIETKKLADEIIKSPDKFPEVFDYISDKTRLS